ncbi:arginyltransferase [Alphaproteobacteria bacterium]|nr:arginyltransferase [Alphaproteobacteria bacterium]
MNKNLNIPTVKFYKTQPLKCPYLPNRDEQLLFTYLTQNNSVQIHDIMANAGFRRSHRIIYKPDCSNCSECLPVRIRVKDHIPSNSQKRIIKKNSDINIFISEAKATEEQFKVFQDYQKIRHRNGNMSLMDFREFQAMIEDTPVKTYVIEYRKSDDSLIAVALTDQLQNGLSMVYSFFCPYEDKKSLGTWMILNHIQLAKNNSLSYIYLGYMIDECRKMSYKKDFKPLEILKNDKWI